MNGAIIPPGGRGCGHRKKSGVYAETGVGPNGVPIEFFLIDPPVRVNAEDLGLSSVGVKLIEWHGVFHVFDIVGEEFYPNCADYIEETRRFGASRRLPTTLDFSKLTAESRLILLHRRAWVVQFEDYLCDWREVPNLHYDPCPKKLAEHSLSLQENPIGFEGKVCAGVYWQDLNIQIGDEWQTDAEKRRLITRHMPSFTYEAWESPVPEPKDRGYHLAMFLSLPIHRLAVVTDHNSQKEQDAYEAARNSQLPVDLVDE